MRKKIIFTLLIVAIVAIGGFHLFNDEPKTSITPADIIANLPTQEEIPTFDKNQSNSISKFLFEDFDGGCVYSLDQKIFLLTENSDAEQVICYLDCATEEKCKPIALTSTGNYMIFENEDGEKIAVQMEKSTMERLITPTEAIPFNDLAEQEKNSLFELIEA